MPVNQDEPGRHLFEIVPGKLVFQCPVYTSLVQMMLNILLGTECQTGLIDLCLNKS